MSDNRFTAATPWPIAVVCSLVVATIAASCSGPQEKPYVPKTKGAHVRVVNGTDRALSFVLQPRPLGDKTEPGSANPFQKERSGKRELLVKVPGSETGQTLPLHIPDGQVASVLVTRQAGKFQASLLTGEPREAAVGSATLVFLPANLEKDVDITLRSRGQEQRYRLKSGEALSRRFDLQPGPWEILVNGRVVARRPLEAGIAYTSLVRSSGQGVLASVLRNSPLDMVQQTAGAERAN